MAKGEVRCTTSKMLRAKDIGDAVWQHVEACVRNPEQYLEQANQGERNSALAELRAGLTHVVNQLSKLETDRQNVGTTTAT